MIWQHFSPSSGGEKSTHRKMWFKIRLPSNLTDLWPDDASLPKKNPTQRNRKKQNRKKRNRTASTCQLATRVGRKIRWILASKFWQVVKKWKRYKTLRNTDDIMIQISEWWIFNEWLLYYTWGKKLYKFLLVEIRFNSLKILRRKGGNLSSSWFSPSFWN